ncbi:glycine/D-amino acid oxidase-like deaminating enzyme [Sinorhizobium fredii]|uniref:Putative oxidoreductase OrdL n=1 Tax=Sinorhizobium fredii (strain USDA 257) TaxID=1185652 RepID=I3X363_SINF2|nr:FAD-binding oxidoreductase [Sinorhizobium fredii]AFL50319.1 putative oxidoreductase OrdL [Sinorhizobium fredii USDA 257]
MTETILDKSLYRFDEREPSYWEATVTRPAERILQSTVSTEVAIIGGGFTGSSAALHLARDYGIGAVVLDAGSIGWGASGRNGGFVNIPASKLSVAQLVRRFGLEETKRFFAASVEASKLPKALAEEEGFDIKPQGRGWYTVAHHPNRMPKLRDYADRLQNHFQVPCRILEADEFRSTVHNGTEAFGGLHMDVGHALHPLSYCLGIAGAAERRGAELYSSSPVVKWEREGSRHRLVTAGGTVLADRVIVATNGYTSDRLHPSIAGRILPAISNILVTRPLSREELAGQNWLSESPIINTRTLVYYYRLLPDRRILFGARGDVSGNVQSMEKIRQRMSSEFARIFPTLRSVSFDYFWRGVVALSQKLTPSLGQFEEEPSVYYALGYQANGVATAPYAGKLVAKAIGERQRVSAPLPMAGLPARFLIPTARPAALAAAYTWYRFTDWYQDRKA